MALMTRPRALRLLLMDPASLARSSVAPDLQAKHNLWGSPSCLLQQTRRCVVYKAHCVASSKPHGMTQTS